MARKLRILAIGHSYTVGMNRAVVRRIAKDPDFDLTIAAPSTFRGDFRPLALEAEPSDSPARLIPITVRFAQRIHLFHYDQKMLDQLIQSENFDIVDAWEEPYIFAGYQIARALRRSDARFSFLTCQNNVKRYPPPFGYFEKKVLSRAQGWVAAASLVYQAMLRRDYPKQMGHILNLAVDTEAFVPPSSDQRQKVAKELGLFAPVIGFVGRLTPDKGVPILMSALDRLLDRKWSLLFLGSGECHNQIVQWIRARGLSGRVKVILAKHEEVPHFMAALDLLVAPSQTMKNWREQFGRMMVEAFACGVPVIASDSGEIPHVVGNAGRIISEADVAAWAQCIAELLEDNASRMTMSQLGLKRAADFSVTVTAEKYKDYYRWLAGQPLN